MVSLSSTFPQLAPNLVAEGFFDKAAVALKSQVASEPQNRQAWERLIGVQRCAGDLEGARQSCEIWLQLQPDDPVAALMFAVLSEHNLPIDVPEGCSPCPFFRLESFLAESERDRLLELAYQQFPDLAASTVGEGHYRPETRSSKRAKKSGIREVRPTFAARITELLPRILPHVLPQGMKAGEIEVQMTAHADGDFYTLHRDNNEAGLKSRLLSYVYYFYRQPKGFTGGDLLLYDSDVKKQGYLPVFTRIEPRDNMLVFFPSGYFHQVGPVHCDEPKAGRFTVNGWVHAAK